jgi:hypothetical protein
MPMQTTIEYLEVILCLDALITSTKHKPNYIVPIINLFYHRRQMNKTIKISSLSWELLAFIAKKQNKKPDDYVEQLIQIAYNSIKK